jgi:hypothetical protein
MEAAIGFEPMHRGFADLSLTTWVRRLKQEPASKESITALQRQAIKLAE